MQYGPKAVKLELLAQNQAADVAQFSESINKSAKLGYHDASMGAFHWQSCGSRCRASKEEKGIRPQGMLGCLGA